MASKPLLKTLLTLSMVHAQADVYLRDCPESILEGHLDRLRTEISATVKKWPGGQISADDLDKLAVATVKFEPHMENKSEVAFFSFSLAIMSDLREWITDQERAGWIDSILDICGGVFSMVDGSEDGMDEYFDAGMAADAWWKILNETLEG